MVPLSLCHGELLSVNKCAIWIFSANSPLVSGRRAIKRVVASRSRFLGGGRDEKAGVTFALFNPN